ncbi:hypothetical protein F441_22853 [Phytophthora nicotianae CJ01A1]|uniref:Uncharacterized protein n=1 Tax=Phytophthora nicotianae CJ01A1 TaxID=1317063 RepID=W2VQ07_PHYNI|nr:hypothetical protein F441_22853 [Phytophthora nicotianae CJ01A1]
MLEVSVSVYLTEFCFPLRKTSSVLPCQLTPAQIMTLPPPLTRFDMNLGAARKSCQ